MISKILKIIKAPMKALSKARDCYVRSMKKCAGDIDQIAGGVIYGEPQTAHHFPRSLSDSKDEDFRELIRAASTSTVTIYKIGDSGKRGISAMPRSRTVVIQRIDEDRPSEIGHNEVNMDVLLLRSSSNAVSTRYRKP